ncbi:MAG TPA: hypothetical protein DCK79_11890 [Candidatus Atribacteria bacterium]|nr:hypothetical protein [Candidatus Atribacteria bacterium]
MNELLEKEEKYNLWDFEINSLYLWPLIRTTIFSKYKISDKGYSNPHYAVNKYNMLSPKLWKHHLKTFYLLNVRRDCFDVLFFNTAVLRYFNNETKYYENRLYGRYFKSFSKPLNFENNFQGFFPNVLPKSENTFIFETLTILLKLNKEINKYKLPNIAKDDITPFSNAVNSAFPNIIQSDYIDTIITKNLISFPVIKKYYFNKIIPRITNKIAFVHCASYLGGGAILTKILHLAGFKVIEVQHGFVSEEHYAYNYPKSCIENENHQCREYLPDYLLMFGDYWTENIRTPSKKIVVGYPYLNKLSEKLIQKITPEGKTILIVSQGTVTEHMVSIAKELSRAFSDYRIIFKLHPGEIPFKERYSSLKSYSNIEIIGNYNIYELIAKNNIIIGYYSTTLFEALKFPEKRIFILENSDVPDEIGYKFSSADELIDAIKDNSKGYSKVNPEYFWASNWEERFREFMKNELNY